MYNTVPNYSTVVGLYTVSCLISRNMGNFKKVFRLGTDTRTNTDGQNDLHMRLSFLVSKVSDNC